MWFWRVPLSVLVLTLAAAAARDFDVPAYWAVMLGWALAAVWDAGERLFVQEAG